MLKPGIVLVLRTLTSHLKFDDFYRSLRFKSL